MYKLKQKDSMLNFNVEIMLQLCLAAQMSPWAQKDENKTHS